MEIAAIAFLSALAGGLLAMLGNLIVANRASEHRIKEARYSRVYERRMEVLAAIYRYLVDIETAYEEMLSAIKASREDMASASPERISKSRSRAESTLKQARQHFGRHRLYLDPDICQRIDLTLMMWHLPSISATLYSVTSCTGWPDGAEVYEILVKEVEKIPQTRAMLETRFRETLGIDNGSRRRWWAFWRRSETLGVSPKWTGHGPFG